MKKESLVVAVTIGAFVGLPAGWIVFFAPGIPLLIRAAFFVGGVGFWLWLWWENSRASKAEVARKNAEDEARELARAARRSDDDNRDRQRREIVNRIAKRRF